MFPPQDSHCLEFHGEDSIQFKNAKSISHLLSNCAKDLQGQKSEERRLEQHDDDANQTRLGPIDKPKRRGGGGGGREEKKKKERDELREKGKTGGWMEWRLEKLELICTAPV